MIRTPVNENGVEKNCNDMDKKAVTAFNAPTGRLTAVTRKGNELAELINGKSKDFALIRKLFEEYEEKVATFKQNCESQELDENQSKIRKEWFEEKYAAMVNMTITVTKYLEELTGVKKKKVKSISISEKSRLSEISGNTITSSARLKLAQRKAKLQAMEVFNEKLLRLEQQKLLQQHEIQRTEREKMKLENDLLEKELDKLDQVATELKKVTDENYCNDEPNAGASYMACNRIQQNVQKVPVPEQFHNFNTFTFDTSMPHCDQSSENGTNHFHNMNNKRQYLHSTKNVPLDDNSNLQLLSILQTQADISAKIAYHQEKADLPRKEITIFNGNDPTDYYSFIQTFKRVIENKCQESSECFYYLKQYTAGIPHDIVKSCNQSNSDLAYAKALELLHEEYGNQYKTAAAYLEKLENWPAIKSEDGVGMRDLSIYMTSCLNSMEDMTVLNQLNNPKEIMNVVKKLPFEMRKRWRDITQNLTQNNNLVTFADLVKFVKNQAKLINQPVFGDIRDTNKTKILPQNTLQKKKVFSTQTNDDDLFEQKILATNIKELSESPDNFNKRKYCYYCKKNNHSLDICLFFKKLTYDKRVDYIKKTGLCFACLTEGHSSKGCLKRVTCKICNKKHPTLLHRNINSDNKVNIDTQETPKETITEVQEEKCLSVIDKGAGKVLCPVVPVKIKIAGTGKYVKTYAALDTCSTACFMSDHLLALLGAQGKTDSITVSTMEKSDSKLNTKIVNNLELYDLDNNLKDTIPVIFAQKSWPFSKDDAPKLEDNIPSYLNDVPLQFIDASIGIIIGMNRPKMLQPLKIVCKSSSSVYASLHRLGWALNGIVGTGENKISSHRIKIQNIEEIESMVRDMYDSDFKDSHIIRKEMSPDDLKWQSIMEKSCNLTKDSHYEYDLPMKPEIKLENNEEQVYRIFLSLLKKLKTNDKLFEDYKNFMNLMLENGFMEKVPEEDLGKEKVWYLSHHGVYHKKKNKIRVVFNGALKYKDVSLNDALYKGPDLANNLLGVLLRFRANKIAFTGDIIKMFYQVKITKEFRDFLRFYWLENQNIDSKPCLYRLTVHLFGATSSPSVANFALRQTVRDNCGFSDKAKNAVLKNFYVDDLLCSVDNEEQANLLLQEIIALIAKGGFQLSDITSNSPEVLSNLNKLGINADIKCKDLSHENINRVLGLMWNINTDTLSYSIKYEEKPITKRNILSTIHKVFDPLGLLGPAIVPAKKIFQDSCKLQIGWDTELPCDLQVRWKQWINNLPLLENFEIKRCNKPDNVKSTELHYFSDGSEVAYSSIVYVRFIADNGKVTCSPLLAKDRCTPLNDTTFRTIPRIELNGAKLSVILKQILDEELDYKIDKSYFWTDSCTVLKYVKNCDKRYSRFVTNRINFILSSTDSSQWMYVPGNCNPADASSRGISIDQFLKLNIWTNGPNFLLENENKWPSQVYIRQPQESDLEIVKSKCITTVKTPQNFEHPIEVVSTKINGWYKLKKIIAWLLRIKTMLFKKTKNCTEELGCKGTEKLCTEEIKNAEQEIIKFLQDKYFSVTIESINNCKNLQRTDKLRKLDPFIDDEGLLRVGGRIKNSRSSGIQRHPIILPNHKIVHDIVLEKHKLLGHMGRETVAAALMKRYWIFSVNSIIKTIMFNCIICRRENAQPIIPKMASLPEDRLSADETPFTRTGVDYFGPFEVVNGRKKEKRYGVVFSCLSSRAIHLEMAHSLSTDSFINCFRRFISRRGNVKIVRSDNGTNLTAGEKELKQEIRSWNENHIHTWMTQREIEWKFQPPSASHFGGIFEREIRSVKKVLRSLLREQPMRLCDEQLNTLLCEIENILNCRPLTRVSQSIDDYDALTPNHLLLRHSGATFPPGLFSKDENYAARKWRQVQYLSDLFWHRWKKEYLPLLQERQKWYNDKYNYQIGDLVLVVDQQLPRNQWPLARIIEVFPDEDGTVRVVKVKIAKYRLQKDNNLTGAKELERPVAKLILMKCNEE